MASPLSVPLFTLDDLARWPRDGNLYELLDGVLLVTPQPESAHQGVLTRLVVAVHAAVDAAGLAHVVSPGEISRPPRTSLEPDLLVFPARFPLGTAWRDIADHWLAVEVYSPSSRRYDREFKRDAYLALGVREVWLVDIRARTVEVARLGAAGVVADVVTDVIRWHPPELPRAVEIDLRALFRGVYEPTLLTGE